MVADEPTQQDCFRNCFWWSQMCMHPSELPCDAVVVLSGHDSVANTSSLYAHLSAWVRWLRVAKEHGLGGPRSALELVLHEGWSHGWICFHRHEQRKLIRRVLTQIPTLTLTLSPISSLSLTLSAIRRVHPPPAWPHPQLSPHIQPATPARSRTSIPTSTLT